MLQKTTEHAPTILRQSLALARLAAFGTPTPRFQTNNMVSLKMAACGSLGVAALPAYICRRELAVGSLVQVLPGWTAMVASFSAVLPYRAGVSPAVRALLDFLAGELPKALGTKPRMFSSAQDADG